MYCSMLRGHVDTQYGSDPAKTEQLRKEPEERSSIRGEKGICSSYNYIVLTTLG